ncbi:MAG: hypothetical protein M3Y59_24110 [Myxococcota bacterium]|nr:hypothetical protein [Myxococcota bacterium]
MLVYLGYHFLYGQVGTDGTPETPKATLDRIQDKADDLEADLQKRADEIVPDGQ